MRWESQSIFHKDAYQKTLAIKMVGSTNFLDKCIIAKLGTIDYDEAYQIQKRLYRRRFSHVDVGLVQILRSPLADQAAPIISLSPMKNYHKREYPCSLSVGEGMSPITGLVNWLHTRLWT